jgi:hypothetical protein
LSSLTIKLVYLYLLFSSSYVFWFGDLNFRLDKSKLKSAEEIAHSINNGKLTHKTANTLTDAWAQDELSLVMKKSKAFEGFFEILPMFPPTYRYIFGSSNYDLKYVFILFIISCRLRSLKSLIFLVVINNNIIIVFSLNLTIYFMMLILLKI